MGDWLGGSKSLTAILLKVRSKKYDLARTIDTRCLKAMVRRSDGHTIRRTYGQTVRRSDAQTVRRSDGLALSKAGYNDLKRSDTVSDCPRLPKTI